jgi:hypothetical protein
MYWIRTGNIVDPIIFLVLSLCWAAGGGLLVTCSGRFRKRERLLAGIAFGLVIYTLLANGLAHFFSVYLAFIASAILIFIAGWLGFRRSKIDWPGLINVEYGLQLFALISMSGFLTLVIRGLDVGDDFAHLPLVSTMAAGDIPPHYSAYTNIFLPYHYGLDLFAASVVKVGGFFPWSSWDMSRAFAASLTILLSWLWLQRITRSRHAAFWGTLLIAFGMGARWLLLLLPRSWIANISSEIQIIGSSQATGKTLLTALYRPWVINGGPPVPIPFAFANGIMNPLTFEWSGSASLPFLALILILMISSRRRLRGIGLFLLGTATLSLALSAEHIFVLIILGVGLAAFITIVREQKPLRQSLNSFSGQFLGIALLTTGLSFIQGGVITEVVRSFLTGQPGVTAAGAGNFSLHWVPVFYDSHFGSLSLLNWRQLIVVLAECGLLTLLFPIVLSRMREDLRHRRTLELGFGLAAFFGVFIPLFINYYVARDITRFTGFGLSVLVLLAIQPIWVFFKRARVWKKCLVGLGYALTVFGGMVLFAYQATAIFYPKVSTFITSMDSRMSQAFWDRLGSSTTLLFDPIGHRGQTVFGRPSIDGPNGFTVSEFVPFLAAPDPTRLRQRGFEYLYFDRGWWDKLAPAYQQALYAPCTRVIQRLDRYNSATGELSDFRVLVDITNCK